VQVAALLADHVELVEEENAAPGPDLVEEAREPDRRLAEVAGDH